MTFEAIQVKFRGKARGFAKSKCEFSECKLRKIDKEQRYIEKRLKKHRKKNGELLVQYHEYVKILFPRKDPPKTPTTVEKMKNISFGIFICCLCVKK